MYREYVVYTETPLKPLLSLPPPPIDTTISVHFLDCVVFIHLLLVVMKFLSRLGLILYLHSGMYKCMF